MSNAASPITLGANNVSTGMSDKSDSTPIHGDELARLKALCEGVYDGPHWNELADLRKAAQRLIAEVERLTDLLGATLHHQGIAVKLGSREFYVLESAYNGRVAKDQQARAEAAESSLSAMRTRAEKLTAELRRIQEKAQRSDWRQLPSNAVKTSQVFFSEWDMDQIARALLEEANG